MAAIIGGIMKAEPKKHLWQFLDSKLTVLKSGTGVGLRHNFLSFNVNCCCSCCFSMVKCMTMF